jgi:hypothetical protein
MCFWNGLYSFKHTVVRNFTPTAVTESNTNIFRVTLMAVFLFLPGGTLCMLLIEWLTNVIGFNTIFLTIATILTVLVALSFILIELPIALALTIDNKRIVVKNLLTKKVQVILFQNIHSFKISIKMRGYRGFILELILLKHGEALHSIPLQYIGNLDEIIKELEKHLRNLTEDEYGFLKYIREHQIN